MGRWEPGARARLSEAALELYAQQGFEQTMVGEIAARAGVTSRTFFRHYSDKREVLFGGWPELQEATAAALRSAPADTSTMGLVTLALRATARLVAADPARARTRHAIITATPELRERELIKYDALAADLARGLRERGADPTEAALAAHTGVTIYRVAFEHWVGADNHDTLEEIVATITEQHRHLE